MSDHVVAWNGVWASQDRRPVIHYRPRRLTAAALMPAVMVSVRIAMGALVGVAFGALAGKLAFWLVTGLALGALFGAAMAQPASSGE